ncbi:hypothetical protein MtrunA17_Chr2g0331301 [Medicago truncatula]|uniref:Transmembrane protein n=1 Tax=Medicago truncatula TaxID=3880 RepID=A0A396JMV7_MEDTR|nr:hypothetical protein MtrunA17_Chr2g0331301 [Medicago truncatula]
MIRYTLAASPVSMASLVVLWFLAIASNTIPSSKTCLVYKNCCISRCFY